MMNNTMMGASAPTQTSPSFRQCLTPPCEDATSGGIVTEVSPTPIEPASSKVGDEARSRDNAGGDGFITTDYSTDDIPNTEDNIAAGKNQTYIAMGIAAVILAFIFLKKKK